MYNVYFTIVEMMFVNFCTHLCKVQLPVCIFVNLSLTIMCFFDAFVCTLHFACIQIVKRLLVSPSIVRIFLLLIIFSFFLSGLCLMMKDGVCITLTTRLTPPLKGRLL